MIRPGSRPRRPRAQPGGDGQLALWGREEIPAPADPAPGAAAQAAAPARGLGGPAAATAGPAAPPAEEPLVTAPGAGLPQGTEPVTSPAPWGGPRRPGLLLYPDDTLLAVRGQGEDADQTWPGAAAGAAP